MAYDECGRHKVNAIAKTAKELVVGVIVAASSCMLTFPAVAAPVPVGRAEAKDVITIYHLEGRRSLRVIWLCEELGLPYNLMFKPGDFAASSAMLQKVNPIVPMYPTVIADGHLMIESGAILEYILSRYAKGKLQPAEDSADYPYYLQFLHFAEGTAMARQYAQFFASLVAKIPVDEVPMGRSQTKDDGKGFRAVGNRAVLEYLDDFLGKHPYFGGSEFSAADIMMSFPIRGSNLAVYQDTMEYRNIAAWRLRVETRPAFIRANNIGTPQGWDEYGMPKTMPHPFKDPPIKPGVPRPPGF
jgi:glutathione S-transferase